MNWHYHIIRTTFITLPILLCLLVLSFCASFNVGKAIVVHRKNITCIDQERDALLKFKHQIQCYNYFELMYSWGNPNTPDCCTWEGVTCSNHSGHVIELHLPGVFYDKGYCANSPVLSPSLSSFSELQHLKYLDLSSNNFNGSDIPSSVGSLVNLIHLNLSSSYFRGNIPDQLRNLTHLTSLDLSRNYGLSAKSLNWLSRLSLLRDINLSGTNLSESTDWTQSIGSLPLLEVLQMDDCELSTPLTSLSLFANLRIVSLSGNDVRSPSIFQWLFKNSNYSSVQQSLEYLDLSYNLLQGPIPDALLNLEFLKVLDLSWNSLSSTIPDAIGNLKFLTYLDFSNNSLSSIIPDAIGNLKFLTYLDLSWNALSGPIPSALGSSDALGSMHSLLYLDLSHNRLEGSIPSTIGYSCYSIQLIDLSNNYLQGPVPSSLGEVSSLSYLDLSNNHLEGTFPTSVVNLKYLAYLDLSSNKLSGVISCNFEIRKVIRAYVNFSYNNLSGLLPTTYLFPTDCIGCIADFHGNPNLHMSEFQDICEGSSLSEGEQVSGDDHNKIYPGLYVSIALGFYTGFWVFCGTLTVKVSWRHAYFAFLDHIIDKIYVIVAVYLARFRRNSEV